MNLCADGHEEVCYEVRHCPMCKLYKELDNEQNRTSTLEKEVEDLEKRVQELEDELSQDPTVKWIEAHQKKESQ